ncbi:MAG: hypothetical protein ACP5TW_06495, partial [Thermoplasmata archaeon]
YVTDLKAMEVGESVGVYSDTARDGKSEIIKCLYKDDKGILLLKTTEFWDDVESREESNWLPDETDNELIYIEFH